MSCTGNSWYCSSYYVVVQIQPNIMYDLCCTTSNSGAYIITRVRAYFMCIIRHRVCLLSLDKYFNKGIGGTHAPEYDGMIFLLYNYESCACHEAFVGTSAVCVHWYYIIYLLPTIKLDIPFDFFKHAKEKKIRK